MSKEATDLIWDHSTTSGTHKLAMLALARLCDKRRRPFLVEVSASAIAPLMGVKEQQARRALVELSKENKELMLYQKGIGKGVANLYIITCKPILSGLTKPARSDRLNALSDRDDVESAVVVREEPPKITLVRTA